jgi:hypothetical protein
VPPRGLRRELPLAKTFNERKGPFAERNLALGEGLESCSGCSAKQLTYKNKDHVMKQVFISLFFLRFRIRIDGKIDEQ